MFFITEHSEDIPKQNKGKLLGFFLDMQACVDPLPKLWTLYLGQIYTV